MSSQVRGGRRAAWIGAGAIAAAAGLSAMPPPADAKPVRAEVVVAGDWRNGTMRALRSAYGDQVAFRRARTDAQARRVLRRANARRPGRADDRALVVDAREVGVKRLSRSRAVRTALRAGNWLLVLNAGPRARRTALARHVGSATPGHTVVTAVRRGERPGGQPDVEVVDFLAPAASSRPGARAARRAVQRRYAKRLYRTIASDRPAARAAASGEASNPVPASLLTARWRITTVGSPALRWPSLNSDTPKGDAWRSWRQTPMVSSTQTFTAYLSNDTTVAPGGTGPEGPTQYLYWELDGTVSPILDPSRKDQFIRDPLAGGWQDNRGWWTASVDAGIRPPAGLTLRKSAPVTPNSITQYTSGTTFSIGFSATAGYTGGQVGGGNIGGSINASYSYSDTVTREIPDWGVRSRTSGNHAAWTFFSKSPCDASGGVATIIANEGPRKCFAGQGTGWLGNHQKPMAVNDLSGATMDFHASALWQTSGLMTEVVEFTPQIDVTMAWTWWGGLGRDKWPNSESFARKCPLRCSMVQVERFDGLRIPNTDQPHERIAIDLGAVVPVGVERITFHEREGGPALDTSEPLWIGTANQRSVVACVTLARPAPAGLRLPVGTTNLDNFYADGTMSIPFRGRSGCFPVSLKANRLGRCEAITAEVGTFYARPHIVPLTIRSGSPAQCRDEAAEAGGGDDAGIAVPGPDGDVGVALPPAGSA